VDDPAVTIRRLAAAAVALLALAGCGGQPTKTAAPATAPAATAAPSTAAPSPTPTLCPNGRLPSGDCAGGTEAVTSIPPPDPYGALVCPKILKVMGTQAIYEDADAMLAIGQEAAVTRDSNISFAGNMLADRAELAKAAKGGANESSTKLDMGTAATNLATACTKAGFKE
jgi:hypothetical protein